MKIEKLYTLSQFIDLCDDLYCKLEDSADVYLSLIRNYNNFLKQPLKKEMFVNELNVVLKSDYGVDAPEFNTYKYPSECYEHDLLAFQEAEKKVIFEDVEYHNLQPSTAWNYYTVGGVKIIQDTNTSSCVVNRTLNSLAEVTEGELKLKNINI
jgi:hypothetical protein